MKIVITGSSSGIGRAIAETLLGDGHQVWGIARSDQTSFSQQHNRFVSSRCDVGEWGQVSGVADAVAASWSGIDALIACAGVQGAIGRMTEVDPLAWSQTVSSNLYGTYFPIRAFYKLIDGSESRHGKIICFSGGGATKARPRFSAYGVAKTGIVRLVETLAGEIANECVDVNAVAPGAINTRLTDEVLALGPDVVGEAEYSATVAQKAAGGASLDRLHGLIRLLLSQRSDGISGRLLSAPWDPWENMPKHADALAGSDIYQLRRIVPEDRERMF